MAVGVPYVSINDTAGSEEANESVEVKEIKLMSNDGSNDITFNFDNDTDEDNTIVLKAGEQLREWEIGVGTLYYKAGDGDTAFRFIGTKR